MRRDGDSTVCCAIRVSRITVLILLSCNIGRGGIVTTPLGLRLTSLERRDALGLELVLPVQLRIVVLQRLRRLRA